MDEFYNKHYITVDEQNRIVNGFSDAFRQPAEGDICINLRGGYQFRLFACGEENPQLMNWDYGVPLYKWDGKKVSKRSEEEIAADIAALPAPVEELSQLDRMEAQVAYTAMMTDTLLEV